MNVLGVVLIIPVLPTIMPLIRIWWDTRSQESFERQAQSESRIRVTDFTEFARQPPSPPNIVLAQTRPSLSALTNDLDVVSNLDESEIAKIVAFQFGEKAKRSTDPGTFDRDSAVFHSIKKSVQTQDGKQYHIYEIDLVDQSGNHSTSWDVSEGPDLDYERSMATLDLVNNNAQLKQIYDAFSYFLGEQSSNATNAMEETNGGTNPLFQIETSTDGEQTERK